MKLNKKIASVLGSVLILSTATMLKAQEQPWSFGVEAGVNTHVLRGLADKKFGTNDSSQPLSFMVAGGVTGGYIFHKYVGVGVELLYAQLGGKVQEKVSATNNEKANKFSITTHNLVVPVMVKIFPMGYDAKAGILAVNLGMQCELPMASTVKKSKADDAATLEEDDKFQKAYLKPVNFSFVSGISYEIADMGLVVSLKGSLGLGDIFKCNDDTKAYKEARGMKKDSKLCNSAATLTVGYNFANLLL